MKFTISYMLIYCLIIEMNTNEIHHVCDLCSCDNLNNSITVHCNLKNFRNIFLNSSIETLTLINNSLTFIKDDLIKINNLTSLKSLILSDTPLQIIPELSLPHLINLQLENTSLTTATFPKSYENCTNLQYIVLSNNNLTTITSDHLKFLTLIRNISFDNVGLHSIDVDTFLNHSNTLQFLSLKSNSLKSAEFISKLSNLQSIYFDNNEFDHIPKEFIQLTQIKHISFRNNQIHTINEDSPLFYWTKRNLSNIEIYLGNNPIDCCQSRWFIRYLIGPKNLIRDYHNLTCISPKLFLGKRLIDLHIDLMDCSDGPFYPSNIHFSRIILILLSLSGIVIFILFVVGGTLYRRNHFHFRRRQGYQIIRNSDDRYI